MSELVGNDYFIASYETRKVNNYLEQEKEIKSIRKQLQEYCTRIDKLQEQFEANYDYKQYDKPLKLIDYYFEDNPRNLTISINCGILKDFIEDNPKFVVEDMQNDSELIKFILEAVTIGSEVHNQFYGKKDKYLVDWSLFKGSNNLTFRDEKSRERIEIGEMISSFKNIEVKSFIFSFSSYQKEIWCPYCETWITCSEMNMTKIFGDDVVFHHDEIINKDIYFTQNPLVSTKFRESEKIVKISPKNYNQEHLNILEAFYMILNSEEGINHFFRIKRDQFEIKSTEVYLIIKDQNPIGFAYWNDANTKEGIFICLRQLYIRQEYRNKGYARELLKQKIDSLERFIVESPNEISSHIIKKYFKEKYVGTIMGM